MMSLRTVGWLQFRVLPQPLHTHKQNTKHTPLYTCLWYQHLVTESTSSSSHKALSHYEAP